MVTSSAGPLRHLGPAARWCLIAGVIESARPAPDVEAFRKERSLILREGLAPVALRAFESRLTPREESVAADFREATMSSQLQSMAVDVAGAALLSSLATAGIPTVVIKGPAVALLHPAGWPRTYSDIDVVVPKASFARAVMRSHSAGFEDSPRWHPQWRWFDRFCREGVNLHSAPGGNIDIHHHIPPWSLGSKLRVEGIIERSVPWELCRIPIRIASPQDLMLISTLHVLNDLWKGKLGLASWRDVIIAITSLGRAESAKTFERAGFGWLFDLAAGALSVAIPEAEIFTTATRARPSFSKDWRIAALGWDNDSPLSRHRLSWAMRLPVPNALAFLAGSALPAPSYVRDRHGSLRNYWKEGWGETVSTMHGSDFRMTTVEDKAVGMPENT
jgi:hypothetical protein